MSWTLTTSGAAIAKAGYGANSTVTASSVVLAKWSDEVEGQICTLTRKDWITSYSSVGTNFRGGLSDAASDGIAMKIIGYDMKGYSSKIEAQTMLDILRDNFMRIVDALKDDKVKEKMS